MFYWHNTLHIVIAFIYLLTVVFVITFVQGIYNYIRKTNHVSRVYSVVAILYIQFVLHEMLFHRWNMFCTFYIISIIIIIIIIYPHQSVIREWSSGKFRSQQEIKAIYPSTLQMMCAVLISVIFSSVANRWPGSNWRFWSNPILIVPYPPVITGPIFVLTTSVVVVIVVVVVVVIVIVVVVIL